MRRVALAMLVLTLIACTTDEGPAPKKRAHFLLGLDLHDNRAFAMTFGPKGELFVSGTAHNKRPAVAVWNGEDWEEIDVPEQVWLDRLPSGEVVGIGTKKLYSFALNALKVREIGELVPNPRTPYNQSTARIAGDGAIFFALDAGRFQRVAAGTTTATAIPLPAGTPEDALPGTYARTGDGRMFAGVRSAGIFEVFADRAEMIVPCSDPEIDDCNGGEILVVDSHGKEPLFRKGPAVGKVYRLDLAARRLRLVADISGLSGRLITSVADAPNGDVFLMVNQTSGVSSFANLFRVPAGGEATRFEDFLTSDVPGPAALAVRNDGRVFINSGGFIIQEVR